MNKVGQLRLHSIVYKDGRAPLRVIHTPDRRAEAEQKMRNAAKIAIDSMASDGTELAGMAIVVWDVRGVSVGNLIITPNSRRPYIDVPRFAQERLMAELMERWTREGLRDE